jgi:hypothetical protein
MSKFEGLHEEFRKSVRVGTQGTLHRKTVLASCRVRRGKREHARVVAAGQDERLGLKEHSFLRARTGRYKTNAKAAGGMLRPARTRPDVIE